MEYERKGNLIAWFDWEGSEELPIVEGYVLRDITCHGNGHFTAKIEPDPLSVPHLVVGGPPCES